MNRLSPSALEGLLFVAGSLVRSERPIGGFEGRRRPALDVTRPREGLAGEFTVSSE